MTWNPDVIDALRNGLWAASYSTAIAVALTAPGRALPVVLAAGFAGRFSRDLLVAFNVSMPIATVVAALLATTIAIKASRDSVSVPVAAVTAMLPLGPTSIVFNAIRSAFDVFAGDPAVAAAAAATFTVNSLKAVIIVGAMAVGIAIPLLVARNRYSVE
jgi:uncharacterized membrane protein YjjB (DUF3815 family)